MKTITVIIERSKNLFSAYAEDVEGIYGGGNTVAEAKQSIVDAIALTKEHNEPANIPAILLGEYKLVYKFDTESFLKYYKGIFSNTALSKLTGINEKQIAHYSSGLKKPRRAQIEKIENALHALGRELIEVKL